MSENYTPVNWTENTPINVTNLDNMDGQYQAAKEVVQEHEIKEGGVHGVPGSQEIASKDYVDLKISEVEAMEEHGNEWHTEDFATESYVDTAISEIDVDKEDIRTDNEVALAVEVRTSDPVSPVEGQIWLRSDL